MKLIKFLLFLLLPVLLLIAIWQISNLIRIRSVSCISQYGVCNANIAGKIRDNENGSLGVVKKNLGSVLASSLLVKNFSLQYKFPDKLAVNIIEITPSFAVKSEGKDDFRLVSYEGMVLDNTALTELPYVEINDNLPEVSSKVDDRILFSLKILEALASSYQVKSGKIEADSFTVILPDGYTAIFPLAGDRQVIIGSFILINQRLKSLSKESKIKGADAVRVIDLRYRNPILK